MGDHLNRAFNINVYRDQVDAITNWFNSWNECEQTVVLFSLIKRLNLKQTKFLMIVLEQSLAFDSNQLSSLENLANDSEHLKIIDTRDLSTVFQLLSILPLLRPGNTEAAMIFTKIIPQCVNVCLEQSKNLEESRQLISYALIHPALSSDQRSSLSSLLLALEQQCSAYSYSTEIASRLDNLAVGKAKGSIQRSEKDTRESAALVIKSRGSASEIADNRSSVDSMVNSSTFGMGAFVIRDLQANPIPFHNPVSATMSAPPSLMGSSGFCVSNLHTSQVGAGNGTTTFNMPTPPTPLSTSPDYDSSYGGSTGSLVETCENPTSVMSATPVTAGGTDRSGMKDVPVWLKSLRLHKYSALFSKFTYEEMLALDDTKLSALGVTKGARHKIVLSVAKLNDRGKELRQMGKDAVESGGNVKHLLTDLKNMMNTPIKFHFEQQIMACNERKPSHSSVKSECSSSKSPQSHSNSDESENSCSSSDDQNAPENQTLTFENDNTCTPDNIPDLVCNLLGILCSQILLHPDEDNCSNYIHILDRCYCHEAFTNEQRQKVSQWRTQCQKLSRSSNLRTLGGNSGNNQSCRRPSYPSNGRLSPFYSGSNHKFGGVGVFMGSNPLPVASNGPNNAAVGSGRSGVLNLSGCRPVASHGRSNSISGVAFGQQRFQQNFQGNGSTSFNGASALASASFANTNNKAYVSSYMAEQQQSNLYPFSFAPTQGGSASHHQVQYHSNSHPLANGNNGQQQNHRSNSSNNESTGPSNANCYNGVQHNSLNALPSVGHHSAAGHQMVNSATIGAAVAQLPKVPSNHKPLLRTQSAGSAGVAPSALSVFPTNTSEPHNSNLSSAVAASSVAVQYFSHRSVANNASKFYNSYANNNHSVACNIRNEDAAVVSGSLAVDTGSGASSRIGGGNLSGTVGVGQSQLSYSGMSCMNPGGAAAASVSSLVGGGAGSQQGPHTHRRRLSPSLSSAYEAASATSVDSISSLESLCRSVADHALNANTDHMSPTPSSLIAE